MGMVKEVFPAICDETVSSTDRPFRLYWQDKGSVCETLQPVGYR
jgi:hypothetical protein